MDLTTWIKKTHQEVKHIKKQADEIRTFFNIQNDMLVELHKEYDKLMEQNEILHDNYLDMLDENDLLRDENEELKRKIK